MHYASAGYTDRGVIRPTNQDALLERPEAGLWVVADGIGGYEQGELAARMVCDGLLNLQPQLTVEAMSRGIQLRLSDINSQLHRMATRQVAPIKSGTTVVALVALGSQCEVLWAGDSRAYRLRGEELDLLTQDHVWEESSTITRAVGGEPHLELDTRHGEVERGDRYMLCSDGISRALPAEMIRRCLLEPTLRAATHALIEEAIGAGSSDNVTAVVIEATR